MMGCKLDELILLDIEEWIGGEQQSVGTLLDNDGEGALDLTFTGSVENTQREPERAGRILKVAQLISHVWKVRINQHGDRSRSGKELMEHPQSFRAEFVSDPAHARHIATRPVEARDEAESDW